MRKAILHGKNEPLVLEKQEVLDPPAGEVVVTLRAAALNHRDVWIQQGLYPGIRFPIVLGSDGAGVVSALGEGVESKWKDREVVINAGIDWGENERVQGENFTILGLPRDGTFASQVCVPAAQLADKPSFLHWEHAAALPLAGLTAYRALCSRGKAQAGERVLVTGIGGGVALFALQFGCALGAEVWVSSSSSQKLERAKEWGAMGGANYSEDAWASTLLKESGGFDVIIDGAGGDGMNDLIDLCKPGGRIAIYGATRGVPRQLELRKLFFRQISLLGSTMGSAGDFQNMLQLVEEKKIKPVVDGVYSLDRINDAFAHMREGRQQGKIVVALG